ncbi:MAG: hypothetical protein LBH75_00525 [Treponema sp.]|nr:hypothetical protein [Treponema sp.]
MPEISVLTAVFHHVILSVVLPDLCTDLHMNLGTATTVLFLAEEAFTIDTSCVS